MPLLEPSPSKLIRICCTAAASWLRFSANYSFLAKQRWLVCEASQLSNQAAKSTKNSSLSIDFSTRGFLMPCSIASPLNKSKNRRHQHRRREIQQSTKVTDVRAEFRANRAKQLAPAQRRCNLTKRACTHFTQQKGKR